MKPFDRWIEKLRLRMVMKRKWTNKVWILIISMKNLNSFGFSLFNSLNLVETFFLKNIEFRDSEFRPNEKPYNFRSNFPFSGLFWWTQRISMKIPEKTEKMRIFRQSWNTVKCRTQIELEYELKPFYLEESVRKW